MPVTITKQQLAESITKPRRPKGHVMPKRPEIDINGPGRLRTAHVLMLCSISHSTMHRRKNEGTFPKEDGFDGARMYWNTATIREYLKQ